MKQEDILHLNVPDTEVILRTIRLDDAAAIYHVIDSHRQYLSVWLPFIPNIKSVDDEKAFISAVLAEPFEKRSLVFMIEKAGEFCGLIGFVTTDPANHRTEIGYWLLPEYQGQGIMSRSVRTLCEWTVKERNMNRIQIRCAVGNRPSNAIPLRLNFKLEGTERDGELLSSGQYTDINVYSILKDEVISWKEHLR